MIVLDENILSNFLSRVVEGIGLDNISSVAEVEDTCYNAEVVLNTTLADEKLEEIVRENGGSEVLDNNHRIYYYYFVENGQVFLRAIDDGSVLWCGKDYCTGCQYC